MSALSYSTCALLCLASLACQVEATATPVSRVITLLSKLEGQITNEGKKEAAEYDKAACYCKDQATKTQLNIEKSDTKLETLAGVIEGLDANIRRLEGDGAEAGAADETAATGSIGALATDIGQGPKEMAAYPVGGKNDRIKGATTARGKTHDTYELAAKDIVSAIKGIELALNHVRTVKKEPMKVGLLQDQLLAVASNIDDTDSDVVAQIMSLAQVDQTQLTIASKFKKGGMTDVLEALLKTFKDMRQKKRAEENESLFAFDSAKMSLEHEIKFLQKDKVEQEGEDAKLKTVRGTKAGEKEAEQQARDADSAYMGELTSSCEAASQQFDQRSKARTDELTAIGQAMEQLKNGIADNYGSNSLTGEAAESFLQRNARSSSPASFAKVKAMVYEKAKRLHSSQLTGLALKLNLGNTGFEKVTGLVKDMIKKLEKEAKLAETSKSDCDEGMKKAVGKRDDSKVKIEEHAATIAMETAEKVKLIAEMQSLQDDVAGIQKSILERSELRAAEKTDNASTLEDARDGAKAVETAIKVLNSFYESLLQTGNAQNRKAMAEPTKKAAVNRDGEEVSGVTSGLGDYKGKKEASTGVIGILQVIGSDFARTISNVEDDETLNAAEHERFVKGANEDVAKKNKLVADKQGAIKAAASAITKGKDDKADAKDMLVTALDEVGSLKVMCLAGEGTFEDRKKQRDDEIKALQDVLVTLGRFAKGLK